MKIEKSENTSYLEQKAVDFIVQGIQMCINDRGRATLALPGGRSVQGILKLLSEREDIPWEKVYLFTVDDRMVPQNHKESNCKLIYDLLVNPLKDKFPKENNHLFRYVEEEADKGVSFYIETIQEFGHFDIVILGAGEDGHVAGLFPHHSIQKNDPYVITFDDSPKPPPKRMSCSRTLIEKSEWGVLLFFGEGKREALQNFENKELTLSDCPAKIVEKLPHTLVVSDIVGEKSK